MEVGMPESVFRLRSPGAWNFGRRSRLRWSQPPGPRL